MRNGLGPRVRRNKKEMGGGGMPGPQRFPLLIFIFVLVFSLFLIAFHLEKCSVMNV